MSHSKRNTSRPVFTAHERSVARAAWSATSARLTRDSFLPFAACIVCLRRARDPVSCAHGDVFCRECALASILAQKHDIKRARRDRDRRRADDDSELRRARDAQAEKDTRAWERVQAGLDNKSAKELFAAADAAADANTDANAPEKPRKRKADQLLLEAGPSSKRPAAESSFWTPALTPSAARPAAAAPPAAPRCPGADHALTARHLHTLRFSVAHGREASDAERAAPRDADADAWFCPACVKPLTNASGGVLAKVCGHVCCGGCAAMLAQAPEDEWRCYICSESVAGDGGLKHGLPAGMVRIKTEGTGFSARGKSTVEKVSTTFNV